MSLPFVKISIPQRDTENLQYRFILFHIISSARWILRRLDGTGSEERGNVLLFRFRRSRGIRIKLLGVPTYRIG